MTSPALAQAGDPPPPPRQDTQSATGVSYRSGAFAYSEVDLTIGGSEFPQALVLQRLYRSDLNGTHSKFAGFQTQGWTVNLAANVSPREREDILIPGDIVVDPYDPTPEKHAYMYSVIRGTGSEGFLDRNYPSYDYSGPFMPLDHGSGTLAQEASGLTYRSHEGELTFNPPTEGSSIKEWWAPDGTVIEYHYTTGSRLKSVFSNRGYAILFEFDGSARWTQACAVNLAHHYVTPTSNCPSGVPSVSYSYASSGGSERLVGATNAVGQTTSYSYTGRGHLGCITLPGQSSCMIQNSYSTCTAAPEPYYVSYYRDLDKVTFQQTATGETFSYSFPATQQCPEDQGAFYTTTLTTADNAQTVVVTNSAGLPSSVRDPLDRTVVREYVSNIVGDPTRLDAVTFPEGDRLEYIHGGCSTDTKTETRRKAKPGSALADIVWSADYSTNWKFCHKPVYMIDANGNRTDYTYSADHGGVLTETGPSVNGVRPQTRYEYAQRYAWIKNSSGGYSRAASPVWVLVRESFCRTASNCAGGADEVVTTYDYGLDSGPNNLWVRGKIVTADGESLRTCYRYDGQGNRISETLPSAGLTSCP